MSYSPHEQTAATKRRRRLPGAPKRRNCEIYERHVLAGETQEQVAGEFGISQQRVAQIVARVEGWLATHGDHPLAQQMRLRTNRRWDAIWSRAIEGFDRSREDREVRKERVVRPSTSGEARTTNSGETPLPQEPPVATFTEITIHKQNGDPRFLAIAVRVAEREDRRWQRQAELTEFEERIAALEGKRREPNDDDSDDGPQEPHDSQERRWMATLPPPPPTDPEYVAEIVLDLESCWLKDKGDRAGWKARQLELKRDLAWMIRRHWPDIDAEPPAESTAPRETDEDAGCGAEASDGIEGAEAAIHESGQHEKQEESVCREATRSGTATRPHPNHLPQQDGTAGDDDNRRAATETRKRAAFAPRPFFVAFSSRATQYDG
jgi:hypothetical protein